MVCCDVVLWCCGFVRLWWGLCLQQLCAIHCQCCGAGLDRRSTRRITCLVDLFFSCRSKEVSKKDRSRSKSHQKIIKIIKMPPSLSIVEPHRMLLVQNDISRGNSSVLLMMTSLAVPVVIQARQGCDGTSWPSACTDW